MKTSSLWFKVAASSLSLAMMCIWLLLYEVPRRQSDTIDLHAQAELETISEILAISVDSALERDDMFLLQDIQQSIWQDNDSSFAGVFIETPDGPELIATYPSTLAPETIEALARAPETIMARTAFEAGEIRGEVITGLNADTARARNVQRQLPLYFAVLLLFIFAILLLSMLRRRVILPMQALSQHAEQLSMGNYDYRIERSGVNRSDEVSALEQAFINLRDGLKERDAQQSQLMRELQENVVQLEKATESERRSLEAKQRFVANVSHEIRTPLNGILGLSRLLLTERLGSEQLDKIAKIIHSGEHLLSVINDILNFNKLNAGKLSLNIDTIETSELLTGLVAMVQPLASTKKLEFIVDVKPEFPVRFYGDKQRLSQILLNLLTNAIKFTSTGQVMLALHLEGSPAGAPLLRFRVTDSGPGIASADLNRLFQEFQQLDNSSTREAGGTGLGLVISKKLAELMDGHIEVNSTPGHGSTFVLALPLKAGSPAAMGDVAQQKRPLKVLVVDDNPATGRIMQQQLIKHFQSVISVSSGAEALEEIANAEARNDPLDLIIMDWLMPGMDGIKTARYILSACALTPYIICVTASPEDLVMTLQEMQVDYFDLVLRKPVFGRMLAEAIISLTESPARKSAQQKQQAQRLQDRSAAAQSHPRPMPADSSPRFKDARVLLVEDNDINQDVIIGFLAIYGIDVELARDGLQALALLGEHPENYYDLCLMDLQMPEMDGLTATRHIRNTYQIKILPIIAMTASAYAEDRQMCLDAGMDDFISKPINITLLQSKLRRWIDSAKYVVEGGTSADAPGMQDDAQEGWLSAAGIDERSAMMYCNRDRALLERLLRKLAADWPQYDETLSVDVARDTLQELIRATHSLKGICGTVGANEVRDHASRVNLALLKLDTDDLVMADMVRTDLRAFKLAMRTLTAAVRQHLGHNHGDAGANDD